MRSSPRTLWLLVEARVPIVVAAEAQHVGKTTLLTALLDFLPPDVRLVELAGEDETFDWLPQASELGWPGVARDPPPTGATRSAPTTTVLLAHELSDHTPAYTWGEAARVAVRAASIGYGLAATIHARLARRRLRRPSAGHRSGWPTTSCRTSASCWSCAASATAAGASSAAHYVRPVARDVHGHVQRLGPAVLATWDPADGRVRAFRLGRSPRSWRVRVGPPARATSRSRSDAGAGHPRGARRGRHRPTPRRSARAIRAYRPIAAFDAPRDDA